MTTEARTTSSVKVGQLWSDNDGRGKRIVKVLRILDHIPAPRIEIQRVKRDGSAWFTRRHGTNRMVAAPRVITEIRRFGLKGSAGFTLVRDVS